MPVPGVRCPTCGSQGQEVWVIPGRSCGYCGTYTYKVSVEDEGQPVSQQDLDRSRQVKIVNLLQVNPNDGTRDEVEWESISTSEIDPGSTSRYNTDEFGGGILSDAKWTKIRRKLVSVRVLDQEKVRYEARPDFVYILGALPRSEIERLVYRSSAKRNETPEADLKVDVTGQKRPLQAQDALSSAEEIEKRLINEDFAEIWRRAEGDPDEVLRMIGDEDRGEDMKFWVDSTKLLQTTIHQISSREPQTFSSSVLQSVKQETPNSRSHLASDSELERFQAGSAFVNLRDDFAFGEVDSNYNPGEFSKRVETDKAHIFETKTSLETETAGQASRFSSISHEDISIHESGIGDYLEAASSVASDNASIFSIESNSSLQSSVYDAIEAAEEFRIVLLHDCELRPFFKAAREIIDIQTFKIELHGLLRNYSKELLKEAEAPVEKVAIQFIRRFRRKIAYQVGDELYEDVPETSQSLLFTPPNNPAEIGNESSDDAEDDGDFQRMRVFLLNSQAFRDFRMQLIRFLTSPYLSLPAPKEQAPQTTIMVNADALNSSIAPVNTELELNHEQGEIINDTNVDARSNKFQANSSFLESTLTNTANPLCHLNASWTYTWLSEIIHRFLRPTLDWHHRRIEWHCDCGTLLYGDFNNGDPKELDDLEKSLLEDKSQEAIDQDSSTNSGNALPLTTLHSTASISPTATTISDQTQHTSQNPFSSQGSDPAALHGNSNPSNPTTPSKSPKYVALCVNKGEYYTVLSEIEVSSTTSDKAIFAQIRTKYLELRGFRSRALRLFLIHPTDVNFVHFAVEDSHRVDIISHTHPSNFPPKCEVENRRYEYTPCPLTSYPAIPPNAFLHYMNCAAGDGDQASPSPSRGKKWFNRLPKRLLTSLEEARRKSDTEVDVVGWGIHIIEGPNLAAITLVTTGFIVVCGVGSSVYAVVMGDVSGGFAIGAFVVAAWASLMATLFFQWRK